MKVVASILAAAGAGSLALRLWFPFAPEDPLAGTLATLPLVAGLFWTASRLSNLPMPSHSGTRLGGAAALAALAWMRSDLGLLWGDALSAPVLVAGFFVLLFWQAAAQISVAVGPEADVAGKACSKTPWRYAGFFALVLAVYVGIAPWSIGQRPPDGDEPWYLLLTHSLAHDLDTDLSNNYQAGDSLAFMPRQIGPQPGDPVGPGGERYSRHNMTLPLALAPAYRLAGKAGAVAGIMLLTALFATWQMAVADRLYPERSREVLLASAAAALASPLLLYSHQVWVEMPAALALTVGFDGVLGINESRSVRRTDGLKLAVAVVLLPLLKLRFLLLSVGLLAVAFRHTGGSLRTRIARVGLALLAATTAILLFNQILFGSVLKHHPYGSLVGYWTSPAAYLKAPLGLALDSAFGLLGIAPLWLLALPGLILLWRRYRSLVADLAIVSLPYLCLLGPRREWFGGWSPPFRYGLVFLPFLLLLIVPVFARLDRRPVREVAAVLAGATLCLGLVALVLPGWSYNFADGRSYLLDALTLDFGGDVARFFPSWVRPRTANFAWLAVALAGALLLSRRRLARAGPNAISFGFATLLGIMALLPPASKSVPLQILEFEDLYMTATGGEPYPPRWTVGRAAYQGAWKLGAANEIEGNLNPRGSHLRLALEYLKLAPRASATLEILSDGAVVETVALPPADGWNRLVLDPLRWPGGARLGFRLAGSSQSAVLLNRARLRWSDSADP